MLKLTLRRPKKEKALNDVVDALQRIGWMMFILIIIVASK